MSGRGSRSLWLRWSWRDLRRRLGSVVVIATIIAIGTGVFAGLGSTGTWRRLSNDTSFALVELHDLRVALRPGSFAAEGDLLGLLEGLDRPEWVTAADERLVVPTQVDASTGDAALLVPGQLVGSDLVTVTAADPGEDRAPENAFVDAVFLDRGRPPEPDAAEVVLETKFARYYDLSPGGRLTLAGGAAVEHVGTGQGPEEFLVTGSSGGGFLAEANFAVVYAHLDQAQRLAGLDGRVNDLVVALAADADVDAVAAELTAAVDTLAGVSAEVTGRDDVDAFRILYDDIEGDQQIWRVLSALVLGAASVASFNLISRIVESQRREIGIQMALGVPPPRLAVRPLLVAGQIALLGAVLGIGVGLLVGAGMRSVLDDALPLPVWRTPFQFGVYAQAAGIGFLLPFVATVFPVWRAVRVDPIDAIRTSHLTAGSTRLAALGRRLRLPGNSLSQLPVRNVLRTPRRTLLTALGVGAAIAAMVGILGLLDSFTATIDRGQSEISQGAVAEDRSDRITVQLTDYLPVDGPEVGALLARPEIGRADPRFEVPALATDGDGQRVELVVGGVDLDSDLWRPTVLDPVATGDDPGLILATKAAEDLGVDVGDSVTLVHPVRDEEGYRTERTRFVVAGRHPNPLRSFAYVDLDDAGVFGLGGYTNVVEVRPAEGVSEAEVQRAVFDLPGVASAQPVSIFEQLFDDALEQFVGFIVITAVAVLVLALLIAFNTTSIAVDERARDHATLFAFGLRVRTVVGLITRESVLIGLAATAVGVGLGYLLVRWIVTALLAETLPEFGFLVSLSPTTIVIAVLVGVVAVGLTPLLLARRLARMDIPDTLRVME